jgi:RNA polymerase sigma-70 factor (ECF subfamily)
MLKRIENEASAEDITIETFSKLLTKLHHITLNSSLTPGSSVLLKCTYLLRKKKSSLLLRLPEDQKAYNIADTTPSKKMN